MSSKYFTPKKTVADLEQEFTKQKSTDASGVLSMNTMKSLNTKSPKNIEKIKSSPTRSRDSYGKNIGNLIDELAHTISLKISEKRHLEAGIAKTRLKLNETKEEIRKKEKNKEFTNKKLEQENLVIQKKIAEIQSLEEIYQNVLAKKAEKSKLIEKQKTEFIALRDALNNDIKEKKDEIIILSTELQKEKANLKAQRIKIETASVDAVSVIEKTKSKIKGAKSIEEDRVRTIKSKSKLLRSLIMTEGCGSGPFSPQAAKTLLSPSSQTISPCRHLLL